MAWRVFLSIFLYIGLLLAGPAYLLAEEPMDMAVSEDFELMPAEEISLATSTEAEATSTPILLSEEEPEIIWGCAMEYLNGSDVETERCGYGYYVEICWWNDNIEECNSIFEFVEEEEEEQSGPSNVLFLPGIKGSRLYDGNGNKLWEPFGDGDIEALMLNAHGKSVRGDVHTEREDVVDTVAGFIDIYGSFMEFMDGLVEDETINEWRAMEYDWRLSLPDIVGAGEEVTHPIPVSTDFQLYIKSALTRLARSSKSGKVTIVAHSNGGLVAKQLMLSMGEEDTERLIDKVIFVGVPQSGAPQALGALLYGYKEGLPWWFPSIVSTSAARTFAENSPMGYHLLPSSAYFNAVQDNYHPLVSFGSSVAYEREREAYGTLINNFEELRAYALAEEGGRQKPAASGIDQANVLNETLLNYAQEVHTSLDTWEPPAGIEVHQVAGWGKDTVAGIEYYDLCVFTFCTQKYRPTFIEDGDGVVPVPSALMMSESENVNRYWLNLRRYGVGPVGKRDHGNLLGTEDLQIFLRGIIRESTNTLPEIFVSTQPNIIPAEKKLRFFLHSPLTLGIEDTDGNYSGRDSNGNSFDEIPDAEYGELGEVKYMSVPTGSNFELKLHGYGMGNFTLEAQETEGGNIIASAIFAEIPVSQLTAATLFVSDDLNTLGALAIDHNGDGLIDTRLEPELNSIVGYQETVPNSKDSGGVKKQKKSKETPDTELLKLYISILQVLLKYMQENRVTNI